MTTFFCIIGDQRGEIVKSRDYSRHKQRYKRNHNINITEQQKKEKTIMSIRYLLKNNKIDKALVETNRYLSLYPDDPYGIYQKACILLELQLLDDAESLYRKLVDGESQNKHSSIYKLGIIEKQRKNWELAEQYFRINIETSTYPEIFSRVALANIMWHEQDDYEAALTILNGFYDKQDNQDLVDDIYKRFREFSPTRNDMNYIHLEKAIVLAEMGNLPEATKETKLIIPDDVTEEFYRRYNLLMGKIEHMSCNYEQSIQYLMEAKKGSKGMLLWNILIQIAREMSSLGYPGASIDICKKVMRYMSTNQKEDKETLDIKTNAMLIIGEAYQKLDDYDDIESMMGYEDKDYNKENRHSIFSNYIEVEKLVHYLPNFLKDEEDDLTQKSSFGGYEELYPNMEYDESIEKQNKRNVKSLKKSQTDKFYDRYGKTDNM